MGFKYCIPRYNILPQKDIEIINDISLKILKNAGVRIPNNRILDILYENGAEVDGVKKTAKFPEEMVLGAIKKAGKKHILYGRDRDKTAEFGYNMFNFNGSSGQYQIIDHESMTRRNPGIKDLKKAIKIGDYLENINILGAMVVPSDVPPDVADVITFYHLLTGTTKPFTAWIFSKNSAKIIIEMTEIIAGSKKEMEKFPPYEVYIEPVSPLSYTVPSLEILLEFAAAGLPLGFSPMVQVGATGPCSLIGTIAQENAEILSGITISQLINPGLPVTYGGIPHIFDMKAQEISFGSPEQAMMAAALIQVGKYYGLPVYSNTGLSDSKCMDAQYGIEAAGTLSFGAVAGSDLFGHLGISGADNGASLSQLIIDNEIAGYFIRIFSGFNISEIGKSYEEILETGIGGAFLGNDMTINNFRKEIWYPDLFDRAPWDTWKKNSSKNVVERAIEKENMIACKHQTEPLEGDKLSELKKILKINNIKV